MTGRGALRLANVDARRSKRDCQTARPLHARRHRRDHASQISPGQGHAALPPPIGPARIDLVQGGRADSWPEQSGGIQAIFRVPREPVTQWPRERRGKIGRKIMSIRKCFSQTSVVVSILLLMAVRPLAAATPSESERLEKLERAVEQLQKRNAELEAEVRSLKKQTAFAPEGKMRKQVTYDGKTYVEKAVVEEEKPIVYVQQRGPELKLVLGGFIQTNFEDGDVSAFEGRFGQTALKDRFRLRRARIAMTGDFAEQFDFKMEGDFENSDGTSPSNRTDFSGTDIWLNWHRFPAAQIKIGQYKAPFGLEQLTPDTSLFIIERSLPTGAITPERQIGFELWGKPFTNLWPEQKELLTYYAGIFNGNGRNINNNDNNNFMYVGRLELMPFKGKIFGQTSSLKLGGDVLNSRDDQGTNISPSGNLLVNSDGSLSSFVLPGADERTARSVDAWLNIGPFDLIGEYLE